MADAKTAPPGGGPSVAVVRTGASPRFDEIAHYLGEHGCTVANVTPSGALAGEGSPPQILLAVAGMVPESELMALVQHEGGRSVIVLYTEGAEEIALFALEAGADDRFPLSGAPRELLARIRAIDRRRRRPISRPRRYYFDNYVLDTECCELRYAGEKVHVTSLEFSLLLALVQEPQAVLSREALIALIMKPDADVYDRAIDCIVHSLRQRLPEFMVDYPIRTCRADGYRFTAIVRAG
jgi:two-component system OmpR family response regulator